MTDYFGDNEIIIKTPNAIKIGVCNSNVFQRVELVGGLWYKIHF